MVNKYPEHVQRKQIIYDTYKLILTQEKHNFSSLQGYNLETSTLLSITFTFVKLEFRNKTHTDE